VSGYPPGPCLPNPSVTGITRNSQRSCSGQASLLPTPLPPCWALRLRKRPLEAPTLGPIGRTGSPDAVPAALRQPGPPHDATPRGTPTSISVPPRLCPSRGLPRAAPRRAHRGRAHRGRAIAPAAPVAAIESVLAGLSPRRGHFIPADRVPSTYRNWQCPSHPR
jgi:hypothetical protein